MYSNGVSSTTNRPYTYKAAYQTESSADKTTDTSKTSSASTSTEQGAVYESSSTTKNTSSTKSNSAIVSQMKADLEQRKQQMQSLVDKMFSQQASTWNKGNGVDMYSLLRSGNLTADAKTIAQAKADIADDGYWGVNQTSDRLLSFAKALAGNDASKADEMLEAFKKGFKLATGAWGSKLPDLCQRTYDATVEKFNAWKNGTKDSEV